MTVELLEGRRQGYMHLQEVLRHKVYEVEKELAQALIDRFTAEGGDWSSKEPSATDIIFGDWDCDESPIGNCVYDMQTDDSCIYCHQPDERK